MNPEALSSATDMSKAALNDMAATIKKIRTGSKPINPIACFRHLKNNHLALGIAEYFVNGNISAFKQHFYSASKLALAIVGNDDGSILETDAVLLNALMSDDKGVINAMARADTPELIRDQNDPLQSRFHVHMLQIAILGDYEKLQAKVEKIAKNGRKADRLMPARGADFFSLLMRGDKQGLEDLIARDALSKSALPLFEDFMSYPGSIEAKLCWFKGIEVHVDSPLLPMALMPIEPLAHYVDEYEFIEPGWSLPSPGILASMSRWLKK